MESKYLHRFSKVTQEIFPLRGSRILVELLPKEELKTAGGLVIASSLNDHRTSTDVNKALLGVVLAVGNGYVDDEGNESAVEVKPGYVVMLSQFGVRPYSHFPGVAEYTSESIALTRESEIHCAWPSMDAYQEYRKALNT